MKRSNFKTLLTLVLMTLNLSLYAQKTYTLSSTSPSTVLWSATLPSTCYACTISLGANVTLSIDESATCQNCTFQGGSITMTSQTLNIQYAGSQTTTYFNGTNLVVNGSGKVVVNAPLSLTNTNFTFNNTSSLTTSYEDDLSASNIYLNDNTSMQVTGGSSTPINLGNSSSIVIGNGSTSSSAYFFVNGPTLNVFDNSSVNVASDNNAYINWASFNYRHNANANANADKSYSTATLNMHCGTGYPNSCSSPSLYGPVLLNSSGVVAGTLPVVLTDFASTLNSNHTISLTWQTQQEVNFSHFTIERSADGENWNSIGEVDAKGNSATVTDYSFTDEQPLTGTNFYRLEIVDLNNSTVYSDVKLVRTSVISQISFFPNPARDYVNVSLNGQGGTEVTILLTNAAGQVLQAKKVTATSGTIVTFPVQQVAAGIYFLSVIGSDGSRESSPMLISRS